jgi:hypothetical protein
VHIDKRILIIGFLYIAKFIFGFWLFRTGKPYNSFILTIHKLVSLATLGYIIVIANGVHLDAGLTTVEIITVVLTIVLFLIAISTGGVLSMDKPASTLISAIHKVVPFLSIVSTISSLYLLVWSRSQ